jgi:predicted GH43/DUF377 family glycosyl hydrolase
MKKIISNFQFLFATFIFLTNFIVFIYPKYISAEEFIRYSDNPIIRYDPNISWKRSHVSSPFVISENGIFKMWYAAHSGNNWAVAYATSTDGKQWIDYQTNPVLQPNFDEIENNIHTPRVIKKEDGQYLMYYTTSPDDVSRWKINIAESSDGINWTKLPDYTISITQSWEQDGLVFPFVMYDNFMYHMWYSSRSGGRWTYGYATSHNAFSWDKYQTNPINVADCPECDAFFVYKDGDKFIGYGHKGPISQIFSTSGVNYVNWENPQTILTRTNFDGTFDENLVATPMVINSAGATFLYYTGYDGSHWQIGLAIKDGEPEEPEKKEPVIVIPGLFGSWNKDAILRNASVNYEAWKLNPIVHEYNGVINTLKNLGYEENKDYYVFAYDWRRGLNYLADNLNTYINDKVHPDHIGQKINIIGHSLGGLVGRIYLQKHNPNNINKLITIGSPHQGATQSYKAVEAGELDMENNFMWLGGKLILQLYKDGIKTDKQIVNEKLPVAKDLLPTYDYLFNGNTPFTNITIKNDVLIAYNQNINNIFDYLYTIAGEKGDTPSGYRIGQRTIVDQLLNLYQDGRPIDTLKQIGDYTIISTSAKSGIYPEVATLDHGEIIYKNEAIKIILQKLNINHQNSQITEGAKTQITPGLIFVMLSPAEIEIEFNGSLYHENDGLVFIENAEEGNYIIRAKGKELGRYTILIGQIGFQNDIWDKIEGEVVEDPPTLQTDTYTLHFNPNSPKETAMSFGTTSLINELTIYLTSINKDIKNHFISKAINYLNRTKNYYQKQQYEKVENTLKHVHSSLFLSRKFIKSSDRQRILYGIEKLELVYGRTLEGYSKKFIAKNISKEISRYIKINTMLQYFLLGLKNEGKNVAEYISLMVEISNRLEKADDYLKKKQLSYADIILTSIEKLFLEQHQIGFKY